MNEELVRMRIQELREKYKNTADVSMRKVINYRARLLQIALEKMEAKRTTLFE